MHDLTAETILTAPFGFDEDLQPRRLELTTIYDVGERRLTSTYRGPCVNPPIQRWSVRYHDQASWQVYEPESSSRLNVTEPFSLHLSAQATATAQARACLDLPVATTLLIDTWTTGSLTLSVDGVRPEASRRQTTLAGLARPWPIERLGPIPLAAGRHEIEVQLVGPEIGSWIFGALLMDETGKPLARCAYAPDDESFSS